MPFPCRHRRTAALTALVVLLLAAAAAATVAPAAETGRTHVIVPEDYFVLRYAGSPAVSPDGKHVAWVLSGWEGPGGGRMSQLWVTALPDGPSRRLTFDLSHPAHPAWSGDGWIYFTARDDRGDDAPPHDGSTQVWRIRPDGTRLTPVTRHDGGVGRFALDRDRGLLYYTATETVRDGDFADLLKKWRDLEYGTGVDKFDAVRVLDLARWTDRELLPADRVIRGMVLSPAGDRLALHVTPHRPLIWNEGWSRIEALDTATGAVTPVTDDHWRDGHPSPHGWITEMAWAPDGRALAWGVSFDGYPTELWLAEWNGDDGVTLSELERPDEVTVNGNLRWLDRGRTLCFLGEREAHVRVLALRDVRGGRAGRSDVLAGGDIVATSFDPLPGGKGVVVARDDHTRVGELYLSRKGRQRRLTDINAVMESWILPRIQLVEWTGADGDRVQGILELPAGHDPAADGPLPLIVELHGGPTSSTKDRFRLWIYGRALMPANGYALLSPNYHGSEGYGDVFLTKLVGRENEIEVTDIAAGVRAMIERGVADPDRIGVMGWSNGGFLTNAMITSHPELFRAASSGAGVLDQVIQWGTEDTPGHVINFMQGLPWEVPDAYRKASPLYKLDKVTVPTLIHVGGADPRVPNAHSRALFRGLHHYLHVPVQLVVYPGEPHGLTKYDNRLAKMEWDLAWFRKYLLGETDGGDE